ncbi:flavin reductase family protein [Actinosynnema sp. CA-248983]
MDTKRNGFAVNLLHARGRTAAEVFSRPSTGDRFADVDWTPVGASGLPFLHGHAFAVAECAVAGRTEVGDHTVVFGEVRSIRQAQDVPLLYGLRTFSTWPAPAGPAVRSEESSR